MTTFFLVIPFLPSLFHFLFFFQVTLLPYPSLYFSPFSAVNTSPSIFSFNSYSFTSTLHYLLLFLCANPPLFCFFFGSYVHLVVSYVLKVRLKKDILMESSFRSMQYLPLAWSTFISSITSRLGWFFHKQFRYFLSLHYGSS